MNQISSISRISNLGTALCYSVGMDQQGQDGYEVRPFGEALKYLREQAGLTQGQLAEKLGMPNQSTLSTWESRATPPNKPFMLTKAADILGVPVDDLEAGRIPSMIPDQPPDILDGPELQEINANLLSMGMISKSSVRQVAVIVKAMFEDLKRQQREDGDANA